MIETDEECNYMKKIVAVILVVLMLTASFAGCGHQKTPQAGTSQMTQIGNPWSEWTSIEEAEAAVGFSLGLPTMVAESYNAVEFRTMNNEMIEIVYRDEDFEVCVRKQKGEGQDISGDYNEYETCREESHNGAVITSYSNSGNSAVRQVISCNGYSWSLVAPNGYWGDSNADFVNGILGE